LEKNLTKMNRTIRLLASVLLLSWAVAGGPFWAFLGLYPMASGAWGYCPITDLLKAS